MPEINVPLLMFKLFREACTVKKYIDFSLRSLNATEITLFWDILAHSAAHAHIHSVHTTHSLDTHTHKFVTVIVLVVLSIQKWPKVTGTKQ